MLPRTAERVPSTDLSGVVVELAAVDFSRAGLEGAQQPVALRVVDHGQHDPDVGRELLRQPASQILDLVVIKLQQSGADTSVITRG